MERKSDIRRSDSSVKSDFDWCIEGNTIYMEDLNLGGRSLTNDMEEALTHIREIAGEEAESLFVKYKDSYGQLDSVVPEWINGRCTNVRFFSGI